MIRHGLAGWVPDGFEEEWSLSTQEEGQALIKLSELVGKQFVSEMVFLSRPAGQMAVFPVTISMRPAARHLLFWEMPMAFYSGI